MHKNTTSKLLYLLKFFLDENQKSVIIQNVTPNTFYSFLLYPIRNTFSEKDSHPMAVLFISAKMRQGVMLV